VLTPASLVSLNNKMTVLPGEQISEMILLAAPDVPIACAAIAHQLRRGFLHA
jgi:hypothetical protein